jgi:oligosaccharide repeat unit polymerase
MLYFYATASYPALDRIQRAGGPRTHGALTFYPIARALERLHIVAGPLPAYIPAFLPVAPAADGGAPLSTNASTFLYYPLEDFGVPGALAYALIVGLVSGLAYAWMRRARASAPRLLLAGQVSTALLLTIFVNKFNNTGSWYVLLLTLAPFAFAAMRMRMQTTMTATRRDADAQSSARRRA